MDAPLLAVLALAGPVLLGYLLRLKGAVLAAIVLGFVAGAVLDAQASNSQLVGAVTLGALAGFALGWAGSLTRRLRR